jgi:hypothetical protein
MVGVPGTPVLLVEPEVVLVFWLEDVEVFWLKDVEVLLVGPEVVVMFWIEDVEMAVSREVVEAVAVWARWPASTPWALRAMLRARTLIKMAG